MDDSQLGCSDQITPRDVKKQKHLRPWKLFKQMSKNLPVSGTMHIKPGSYYTLEMVVLFSFLGFEAFLSLNHLSGLSSALLWWQKHHSGISILLIHFEAGPLP